MKTPTFLLLPLAALLATACTPTHVGRDLRAVWAPDDSSILVVRSEYDTWKPSNPYYYDPQAYGYQVVLLETTPPSAGATGLPAAIEVDRFDESAWAPDLGRAVPLSSGGLAQYNPVYWFPASSLAVFSGGNLMPSARRVDSHVSVWYLKPTASVSHAFAAAFPAEGQARWDFLAAQSSSIDSLPSPDGRLLAALYGLFELPPGQSAIGGDFNYYLVLVLFDASTGAALDALVPLPDNRFDHRNLDAYAPLATDAQDFCCLAWAPDGKGIYVFYYQLSGTYSDIRRVRLAPLGADGRSLGQAIDATSVPARPLPGPSGPVSRTGMALIMTISGNATILSQKPFDAGATRAWKPQDQGALVPLADFLALSSAYGF